jgi:hypothetical protein
MHRAVHCPPRRPLHRIGRVVSLPGEPIRVLVVGLPLLVRDMLRAQFDGDPAIEFLDADGAEPLGSLIRRIRPDFAVIPLERSDLAAEARTFLAEQAQVRVLGLSDDQRGALIYQLRVTATKIRHPTPDGLAAAIRSASENR